MTIEELAAQLEAAIKANANLEKRVASLEARLDREVESAENEEIRLSNRLDGAFSRLYDTERKATDADYAAQDAKREAQDARRIAEDALRTAQSSQRGGYY